MSARADALEVEAEVVGDHVELVGRGELDVAPGVREQLGQLGLLGSSSTIVVGERAGTARRPARRAAVVRPETICGSSKQLGHRLALGDALGAERDVDVEAELGEQPLDQRGDARVHRAAQHEELAVAEVVDAAPRSACGHGVGIGVEVLVDRRADDDDDVLGVADDRRVGGGRRAGPAASASASSSSAPGSRNGIVPALTCSTAVGFDVVERDTDRPRVGEGEAERQADVAAATHHDHVERPLHGSRD